MRRLFEALGADGRHRDFLVWAGVGDGSFLGAARTLGARHALYIEPHPGLRGRLLARHALADNELLSERPLWRAHGPAIFYITNDAASSSLVAPVPGQGTRPNIRVVAERPVEADGMDEVLSSLPDDAGPGLLVLDTGGVEGLVLEGASAGALGRFDTIVVPARERERVGARLDGLGFDAANAVHDENGNEWAVFATRAATDSPEVADLRSQLEERQAEIDGLRVQLAERTSAGEAADARHTQAVEALEAEHARVVEAVRAEDAQALEAMRAEHAQALEAVRAEHAQALEAMGAEHAQALEAMGAEHAQALEAVGAEHAQALEAMQAEHATHVAAVEARADALAAERDEANAALSGRTAEAEALRAQLASAGEQATEEAARLAAERDAQAAHALDLQQKLTSFSGEAEQTIAALTRERDTANGALAEATAAVGRLEPALEQERARAAALDSHLASLEEQLVEARQVSSLSVKLQSQRDADLADLQERYRESQATQARQRELLEKLGARLSVASHYFHQLADGRAEAGRYDDGAVDALQADFDGDPR